VYTLTNVSNGRQYVGVSVNPAKRYKQHRNKPPRRMRADAASFVPFDKFFKLEVHHTFNCKATAHVLERTMIQQLRTCTGTGYNIMRGHPGNCKAFWAMHASMKMRRQAQAKATWPNFWHK
jgi:predicted GIY-YIG superfamily endonuclease